MENKLIQAELLDKKLKALYYLEANIIDNIIEIGKIWHEIHSQKLWKYSGTECKTFRQFCEQECMRSHATVYNFINIYKKFGNCAEGKTVEYSRLVKALPFVQDEKDAEDWLHKAITLPKSAYEDSIREAQKKMPTDQCEHPEREQEIWQRCKKCGKFYK